MSRVDDFPRAMYADISSDAELRIRGHLHEIREINDEVIGSRQGLPKAETGYKKTLVNTAAVANIGVADEVASHIKQEIRRTRERPSNRKVRRFARSEVSKAGFPANEYLNTA